MEYIDHIHNAFTKEDIQETVDPEVLWDYFEPEWIKNKLDPYFILSSFGYYDDFIKLYGWKWIIQTNIPQNIEQFIPPLEIVKYASSLWIVSNVSSKWLFNYATPEFIKSTYDVCWILRNATSSWISKHVVEKDLEFVTDEELLDEHPSRFIKYRTPQTAMRGHTAEWIQNKFDINRMDISKAITKSRDDAFILQFPISFIRKHKSIDWILSQSPEWIDKLLTPEIVYTNYMRRVYTFNVTRNDDTYSTTLRKIPLSWYIKNLNYRIISVIPDDILSKIPIESIRDNIMNLGISFDQLTHIIRRKGLDVDETLRDFPQSYISKFHIIPPRCNENGEYDIDAILTNLKSFAGFNTVEELERIMSECNIQDIPDELLYKTPFKWVLEHKPAEVVLSTLPNKWLEKYVTPDWLDLQGYDFERLTGMLNPDTLWKIYRYSEHDRDINIDWCLENVSPTLIIKKYKKALPKICPVEVIFSKYTIDDIIIHIGFNWVAKFFEPLAIIQELFRVLNENEEEFKRFILNYIPPGCVIPVIPFEYAKELYSGNLLIEYVEPSVIQSSGDAKWVEESIPDYWIAEHLDIEYILTNFVVVGKFSEFALVQLLGRIKRERGLDYLKQCFTDDVLELLDDVRYNH
jgi:hypothetical protein